MTMIEKLIRWALERPRRAGLFYRIRAGLSPGPGMLSMRSATSRTLSDGESVVIVGAGIAALTFARALKRLGHQKVTIITKDGNFGGKCVHSGCMPSEHFTVNRMLRPKERTAQAKLMMAKLSQLAEASLNELGFPVVSGEVVGVTGRSLQLANGETIAFDRLVLATGNRMDPPPFLPAAKPMGEFWELQSGEVVIYDEGNPSSLSYADMAIDNGFKVTVCFGKNSPLAHLPSYTFFEKEIASRGIRLFHQTSVKSCRPGTLEIESAEGNKTLSFDALFYNGLPRLNAPLIDGKTITVSDIQFSTASLHERPDIFLLGDASGMLSATEAELQALRLSEAWMLGTSVDAGDFEKLPFRLHARKSLAMVGSAWSLLKRDWRVIDFATLGWSYVHEESGKLWYLYDPKEHRVEAIHLCHRDAGELISLASVLIDLPVNDPRWLTCSVHPSSAEIFKRLVEDVESRHAKIVAPKAIPAEDRVAALPPRQLQLASVGDCHKAAFFKACFSDRERRLGVLDGRPRHYFAALLGVKAFLGHVSKKSSELILVGSSDGGYACSKVPSLSVEVDDTLNLAVVGASGRTAVIQLEE